MSSTSVLPNTSSNCGKYTSHQESYLELIRIILWRTTPHLYNIANDELCNLLYDLCTNEDSNVMDKVKLLLEWITELNYCSNENAMQNYEQESGFVNTISSILWNIHTEFKHINLSELLTQDIFETCWHCVSISGKSEPLKIAFDSLLCTLCFIKPEFHNEILSREKVSAKESSPKIKEDCFKHDKSKQMDDIHLTDEEKLNVLLQKPGYMSTIAVASQSSSAIYQLIYSGIPKILVNALLENVNTLLKNVKSEPENLDAESPSTSKAAKKISSYLTKAKKSEQKPKISNDTSNNKETSLKSCEHVSQIIDFFSECCSEGYMRDWLGSQLGNIFWVPLLELLCYYGPKVSAFQGSQQETSSRIERTTINFFSCVTTCHPRNQNAFVTTFLSVIRQTTVPERTQKGAHLSKMPKKKIISGFTRQMILKIFLKPEYIFVSLRVEQELERMPIKTNKVASQFESNHYNKRQQLLPVRLNSSCRNISADFNKDYKTLKEVKKQIAKSNTKESKEILFHLSKIFNADGKSFCYSGVKLVHPDHTDLLIDNNSTISQILTALQSKGCSISAPCITLEEVKNDSNAEGIDETKIIKVINMEPLPSVLQRFSKRGGLTFLAQHLRKVCPDVCQWNKLPHTVSIPEYSLSAFELFSRLPAYFDILLQDEESARCFLRLVLGETQDGDGNDISNLKLAASLHALPFKVLYQLFDSSLQTTDDDINLQQKSLEMGIVHFLFDTLKNYKFQLKSTAGATESDERELFWPKGTGFATGPVDRSPTMMKKEESLVTAVLLALSSYINPGDKIPASLLRDEIICFHEICDNLGELPPLFVMLLEDSCLISIIDSYLRNDSFLDITRHLPLYRAVLQLLRAMIFSKELFGLLQDRSPASNESSVSIVDLLIKMKICVGSFNKCETVHQMPNSTFSGRPKSAEANDEELSLFISDLFDTTLLMQKTAKGKNLVNKELREKEKLLSEQFKLKATIIETPTDVSKCNKQQSNDDKSSNIETPKQMKFLEERYLDIMKKLQFNAYDIIVEEDSSEKSFGYRFAVSYHFANTVRMSSAQCNPLRAKRLAQEIAVLSTSLPLSYGSSIFLRYDTDRLDIMKVLITGPADTPYSNGCFEFDVYFPPEYPLVPMLVNLETNGRNTVRFNPNFYTGGTVCLSVLNTWHGRPEEMWNAQTSSFLQVLVSIQSLILVPEPYFNEPGYESYRLVPSGKNLSRDYNSKIYLESIRWAMLEQIRNPNPCFKDVIHTHFWLKRNEICAQIENWIENVQVCQQCEEPDTKPLWQYYRILREELGKLKTPPGLEDIETPFDPTVTMPSTICLNNLTQNDKSELPTNNTSKTSTQTEGTLSVSNFSSMLMDFKKELWKVTTSISLDSISTTKGSDTKVEATDNGQKFDKTVKK